MLYPTELHVQGKREGEIAQPLPSENEINKDISLALVTQRPSRPPSH